MFSNRSFWLKASAVISSVGVLLFAFQNCGKAGFDDALEEVQMAQVDATSAAAPFAFDATFDQISYNSCSGSGLSTSKGFYTVMAGAYDKGGVSARPAFIDYAKSKLKPIYPATTVSTEQIKQFVVGTTENAEAQLQMAFRYVGAPQKLLTPPTGSLVQGIDFMNLLMDLTDDRMMEPIFRNVGTAFNYFPLGLDYSQRTIEGKVAYNGDEGVAMTIRNELNNNVLLSLTYTAFRDTPGLARRPASVPATSNIAYGRGYALRFGQEVAPMTGDIAYSQTGSRYAIPNNQNPNNILAQIQEVNLENPAVATGANWTCAEDLRFTIVRAADAATACPKDSYESMSSATYRNRLEIVRRHLRADQWDVSINRHCVVPKQGSCYRGDTGVEETVEYDQRQLCYQDVAGYTNNATKRCAQFISICNRQ